MIGMNQQSPESDDLLDEPTSIHVGVVLPFHAAYPDAAFGSIVQASQHAEHVGLDSVWVGDHIATGHSLLDSTVALACAAAATRRVSIGTAVMIPALRPPAWAARQIASLQYVSGNRLLLGVGVGGVGQTPSEWDVAGVPARGRAERTDWFIASLPKLLSGAATEVQTGSGLFTVTLDPPVPCPDIWVGGTSDPAMRRAARFGNGWLSALLGAQQLARRVKRLGEFAREQGRPVPQAGTMIFARLTAKSTGDPSASVKDFLTNVYGIESAQASAIAVGGTPTEVAEELERYVDIGVRDFVIIPFGQDIMTQYELLGQTSAILKASVRR